MLPLAYKDYTLKAVNAHPERFELTLQKLNALYVGTDVQTDHYFNVSRGKLKWRQGKIENLITHYERVVEAGFEKTIVYRYELNPPDESIDYLNEHFTCIGVITKERKVFRLGNGKIHIDKLSDGQQFVEIEVADCEGKVSDEALIRECHDLKKKLLIQDSDLLPTGYLTQ